LFKGFYTNIMFIIYLNMNKNTKLHYFELSNTEYHKGVYNKWGQ